MDRTYFLRARISTLCWRGHLRHTPLHRLMPQGHGACQNSANITTEQVTHCVNIQPKQT